MTRLHEELLKWPGVQTVVGQNIDIAPPPPTGATADIFLGHESLRMPEPAPFMAYDTDNASLTKDTISPPNFVEAYNRTLSVLVNVAGSRYFAESGNLYRGLGYLVQPAPHLDAQYFIVNFNAGADWARHLRKALDGAIDIRREADEPEELTINYTSRKHLCRTPEDKSFDWEASSNRVKSYSKLFPSQIEISGEEED